MQLPFVSLVQTFASLGEDGVDMPFICRYGCAVPGHMVPAEAPGILTDHQEIIIRNRYKRCGDIIIVIVSITVTADNR